MLMIILNQFHTGHVVQFVRQCAQLQGLVNMSTVCLLFSIKAIEDIEYRSGYDVLTTRQGLNLWFNIQSVTKDFILK